MHTREQWIEVTDRHCVMRMITKACGFGSAMGQILQAAPLMYNMLPRQQVILSESEAGWRYKLRWVPWIHQWYVARIEYREDTPYG